MLQRRGLLGEAALRTVNQLPEPLPDIDLSPKWQRAFHFVVDGVFAYFFGVSFLWLLYGVAWPVDLDPLFEWLDSIHRRWLRLGFMLLYYLAAEVGFGTTVGKLLTGSAVCDADGRPATRRQMLVRTLCRLNPFDWMTFFDRDGKGFHDAFSKTYVIRRKSLKRGLAADG